MTCRTGSWREDVRRFRNLYNPEWVPSNDNQIGVSCRHPVAFGDTKTSARRFHRDSGLPRRRAHPSPILFPEDAIDATSAFLACLKGFAGVLVIVLVCFYAIPLLTGG